MRIGGLVFAAYVLAFSTAVGLAEPFLLGFPAGLLVVVWVGLDIAQRYRRQITTSETLGLAASCWIGSLFATLLMPAVLRAEPLVSTLILVPFRIVDFFVVWAAYYWLARFIIRHRLGDHAQTAEPAGVQERIAEQRERDHEHTTRLLTLAGTGVSLFPLGFLLAFLLVAVLSTLVSLATGIEWDTGFAIAVTITSFFVTGGFWIQHKSAQVFPSKRLLLWLRRFHHPDLLAFPFPGFLETVCRGIAVPVTLQDSSIPQAPNSALQRPAFHILRALGVLALFTSFISFLKYSTDSSVQSALTGAVTLLAFIVTSRMATQLGFVDLRTGVGKRLVRNLLERVRSSQGVPQTLTVVSTPDESWRHWVGEFVNEADAVLVDVTELSDHLHWELQTVAQRLDAEQLILAFGVSEGEPQQLPEHVRKQLATVIGEQLLEQSQYFFYQLPCTPSQRNAEQTPGWQDLPTTQMETYRERFVSTLTRAFASVDAQ